MSKKIIGVMGEHIAANYLKTKGYKILSKNYACRHGEIDIIAEINDSIVFVEVKTRKDDQFAYASQAVNYLKQSKIKQTSIDFLSKCPKVYKEISFDIIECYWKNRYLNHIKNAF